MTEIHQAIEQLDASLHPKTTEEKPDIIELTEAMKITPPIITDAMRQQLLESIEADLQAQLPQLVTEALDAALAAQKKS